MTALYLAFAEQTSELDRYYQSQLSINVESLADTALLQRIKALVETLNRH